MKILLGMTTVLALTAVVEIPSAEAYRHCWVDGRGREHCHWVSNYYYSDRYYYAPAYAPGHGVVSGAVNTVGNVLGDIF